MDMLTCRVLGTVLNTCMNLFIQESMDIFMIYISRKSDYSSPKHMHAAILWLLPLHELLDHNN